MIQKIRSRSEYMEEWRDIPGYPGYQASSLGRIRTHNKVTSSTRFAKREWKTRIMSAKICKKDKTLRVDLWKGKEHKTFLVHRLVAICFLGDPPEENMTVNHKDGNRLNNRLENLEWMTLADNIRYGFENGQYRNVMRPCSILVGGVRHDFESMSEASRFLGRVNNYISNASRKGLSMHDSNGKEVVLL